MSESLLEKKPHSQQLQALWEQNWRRSNNHMHHTQNQALPDQAPTLYPLATALSYNQKDFWFLQQNAAESAAYNAAFTARICSPLQFSAFRQALQTLAKHHAILRTCFPLLDDEPVQVIQAEPMVDFAVMDASDWTSERIQVELAQQSECPFDLEHKPPWRVRLFTLAAEEHILLFSFHHIVVDFWSVPTLLTQLGEYYAAHCRGDETPTQPLAKSYTEYVAWQQAMLSSRIGEHHRTYWAQQLAKLTDGTDVLQLPLDRPLPSVRTFNGDLLSFKLPAALVAQLKTFALQTNATLFSTLLAAFQVLLYRYTAQEKILVGIPTAGRIQPQFDRTIGCIANQTLVLAELAGQPTFRTVLAQVQQAVMGAMVHQEYPYHLLAKQAQQPTDLSRPALAQVIFNMPVLQQMKQFAPFFYPGDETTELDLGGFALQPYFMPQQMGQFFLMVELWENADGYVGLLKYNTDLFDKTTIQRMVGHYQTLLAGIVADPDQPIAHLPLLTEPERQQLLVTWNANQIDVPRDQCIHELFEAQVERTPEAVAVVSPLEGKSLTYRALNQRANQLAAHLQGLGVGPDVLVGICVERSLDMIVGLMGVLKAGGAYVPMDPNYPKDRLAFMLADTQAPILLTQAKFVDELPPHAAQVICLDQDWPKIAQAPMGNPVSAVRPWHRVYCIYTSGSTGKPKGALITHQNFVNNLYAYFQAYQVHETVSSTLQMASFSFDMFGADLQRTLWHGAKLVICPQEWLLDPERLYQLMRAEAVDFAQFVPAVLRNLIQYLEKAGQDLRFLRILNVGGDVWYMHEYEQFQRFCSPTTRVVNSYGITECTIDSSYFEQRDGPRPLEGIVPIGWPFANTQLYILDPHHQPVPIGIAGELYIGGANVGSGYLNRPDLTRQRFMPNPFARNGAQNGAQNGQTDYLYKTGDRARYLPDGNIDFLGRNDYQVKIRGFRVETGEIETLLGQHPNIREAVVLAQDQGTGKRLVAYIVPGNAELRIDSLRAWLEDKLPDYMVPTSFVYLEVLPLTPNGKVNRNALPMPAAENLARSTPYTPPSIPAETQLAAIWQGVLRVEQIGIQDNFFEIGGDSILAIQIISRARQVGLPFTVRQLFQQRTIAQLAALVNGATATTAEQKAPIQPSVAPTRYPLSPMQLAMFRHLQSTPNSPAYWLQFHCRLHGQLDVPAFKAAWQQVVARHAVLRTAFVWMGDRVEQVVAETVALPWHEADWQNFSASEQSAQLAQFLAADLRQTPPLTQAPLLRCALMQCSPTSHRFVISHHHLLTDGWSFSLLLQEVMAFYQAARQEQRVDLVQPRPYRDYIAWLQQQDLAQAETFWQQTLAGIHTPTVFPQTEPLIGPASYAEQAYVLPAAVSTQLQRLARQNNVTLNTLIQGAVALLLSHVSGERDLVFGITFSGRSPDLPAVETIMGLLINHLPLRVQIQEEQTLLTWLHDLLQTQVELEPYVFTPVTAIQRWCNHPQPLFQCNLRFQNFPMDEQLRERWGEALTIDDSQMVDWWHYPLNIVVTPGDTLHLAITYDERAFNRQAVNSLLAGLQQLLSAFVTHPNRQLGAYLRMLD